MRIVRIALIAMFATTFATTAFADTAYKGFISRQDLKNWDGTGTKTFSRRTSTGGTQTLTKIGDAVDVLAVYGDGTSYTDDTITKALETIGTSDQVSLILSPGTWTVDANVDWSSYTNVTLIFPRGAKLSHSTYTMSLPPVYAYTNDYEIYDGTGTVTHNGIHPIYIDWFGTTVDDIQDAFDSLNTRGGVIIAANRAYDFGTTTVTVTEDNWRLIGQGPARGADNQATEFYTDSTQTGFMFQLGNASTGSGICNYAIIENIYWRGHESRTNEANGLNDYSTNFLTVRNCRFEYFHVAIQLRRSQDPSYEDVEIFSCGNSTGDAAVEFNQIDASYFTSAPVFTRVRIENSYGRYVDMDANSVRSRWTSCKLEGGALTNAAEFLDIDGDAHRFTNCSFHQIEASVYGVVLSGDKNIFEGCAFTGSSQTESGGFNITGNSNMIVGCYVGGDATASKIDGIGFNLTGSGAYGNVIDVTTSSASGTQRIEQVAVTDSDTRNNYIRVIDGATSAVPTTDPSIEGTGNVYETDTEESMTNSDDGGTMWHYGITKFDSSGGTATITLGSGTKRGQIKKMVMITAGNAFTISVTNHETDDPEEFTFDAVDETLVLMWTGTEWITIASSGVTT